VTRAEFMQRLDDGLRRLPADERTRILADYESYFSDAEAAGRVAGEVAASLGEPAILAAELRLMHEVHAWRADSRPSVTLRMITALLALAAVHSVAWLPLVVGVLIVIAMIGGGLCALAFGGFILFVEPFDAPLGGAPAAIARAIGWLSAGAGLLALSGAGAYGLANAFVRLQRVNRLILRTSNEVST
jgi:uncharacterized membrane protein